MSAEVRCPGLPPSRERLGRGPVKTLSRGGYWNPDVLLVAGVAGEPDVVVKDFSPRRRLVRALARRWLIRRELRAYRTLGPHPAVPDLIGEVDELALALVHRPGRMLTRALRGSVPKHFLAELREAVEGLHAAGVAHLDLRHRSNVLLGEDGHPVILDFGSALCFQPGGLAARWILPCFAWVDRLAVRKWERKLG